MSPGMDNIGSSIFLVIFEMMYTGFGPPIVAISRPSRKKQKKGDVDKQILASFYLSKFLFM